MVEMGGTVIEGNIDCEQFTAEEILVWILFVGVWCLSWFES